MADARRSGSTGENPDLPLARVWEYTPQKPPCPAWPQPGKELHRMDFDYAPQPVADSNTVYFGSTTDDTVRALDLKTGQIKWLFTTGGPVRFAPALRGSRVYVASDDGCLYCLDAETGSLAWRFSDTDAPSVPGGPAAPHSDLLLGNGRMISRRPIRTGVVEKGGVLYFAAGMWPSHGIRLYAIHADSARELWRNDTSGTMYIEQPHVGASAFSGVAPQGYILATEEALLVPTGRGVPAVFGRSNGRLKHYRPSAGRSVGGSRIVAEQGLCFVGVCGEKFEDEAFVGEADPGPNDGMLAFDLSFREKKLDLPGRYCVLPDENTLYAATGGTIQAMDTAGLLQGTNVEKTVRWSAPVGRVYCMAATPRLLIAGCRGKVVALDKADGRELWSAEAAGQVRGLAVSHGRLIAATDKGAVVCFANMPVPVRAIPIRDKLAWELNLTGEHVGLASAILMQTGTTQGYALVAGEQDSRLAAALSMQSDLHVICPLAGENAVTSERARLLSTDLYGARVAVHERGGTPTLPYAPYFASLIVTRSLPDAVQLRELYRVLRPCGGVLCVADPAAPRADRVAREAGIPQREIKPDGALTLVVRGKLPGAGEWRSQWADPGNTGIGSESLVRLPFDILWFGGPGPDRMMDRHWKASTPLSLDGRVFLTGRYDVIAFDAYTGRELWTRTFRKAGRSTVGSFPGNFVADDDSLYIAVGPNCYRLDQATGRTLRVYGVPEELAPKADPDRAVVSEVDARWPGEWRVFGPIPEDAPALSGSKLKQIPGKLTVGDVSYDGRTLPAVEGVLDFTYLYGGYGHEPLAPGAEPGPYRGRGAPDSAAEGRMLYAFAEIQCAAAGSLTIGAGADWEMQWRLDGIPVFDTLQNGNVMRSFNAANHVFSARVSPGKHVLAVMVRAGDQGWCLVSAGGSKYLPHLRVAWPEEDRTAWGYLMADAGLLVGSNLSGPYAADASAVFALGAHDGISKWTYRARYSVPHTAIAAGAGRVFLLDATPASEIQRSRLEGKEPEIRQKLVALDCATGRELWSQDDVPPEQSFLQYSSETVVVNANAAYEAATGAKLWERRIRSLKKPVIYRDTIIAEPNRYYLRSGRTYLAKGVTTGAQKPWTFARSYGCGSIAGCQSFLFFRSGAAGFFDFEQGGTTTIGGVRPGCAITMAPANGLLVLPESSSGCTCSYNFQTSLALVSSSRRVWLWHVFEGVQSGKAIRHLRLNLGAPGDRRDSRGAPWLGFPRPAVSGAAPVLLAADVPNLEWYCLAPESAVIAGTEDPWLYASGLSGDGKIHVSLWDSPVVMPVCDRSPVIDGDLDEPCWKTAKPIRFPRNAHLAEPKSAFLCCRDSGNLYFAYSQDAVIRDGKPLPFRANSTGRSAQCHNDDCAQILLSDGAGKTNLQLALTSGGAYDSTTCEVRQDKQDQAWNGKWTHAAIRSARQWSGEIAVPIDALKQAGINPESLRVNLRARNQSGEGRPVLVLQDSGRTPFSRSRASVPVAMESGVLLPKAYDVRLHFAETGQQARGARVFDVRISGRTVLSNFDIVADAGGPNRALVKTFPAVECADELTVELIRRSGGSGSEESPILCALEMLLRENAK